MDRPELMIHILDDFNDDNILTTLQYKPKKVVFLRDNTKELLEVFRDVKEFLRNRISGLIVEDLTYNDECYKSIIDVIDSVVDKKPIIHLSEVDEPLAVVMLAHRAWKNGLKLLVSNYTNEKIYELLPDGTCIENETELNLSINDLIEFSGGKIVTDASIDLNKDIYFEYIDWIVANFRKYNKIKYIFRNPHRVSSNTSHPLDVNINLYGLDQMEVSIIYEHLQLFKKNNWITILKDNKGVGIELRAKNDQIKSLVICSGLWLELLTYKVIKEANLADDLKIGVRFIWNTEMDLVENELDILFTVDNRLFCISCKDTPNYESAQLNELQVYAEQIGGEDAVKALVTTREPRKATTINRADEMDIDIITFDGNVDKFQKAIKDFIESV